MSTLEYRGLQLDGFQRQAIEHLQAGRSVLVAAPTGTGKTLVADWIVEEAMKQDKYVVYTAPIKALSNQKYRDYCALYGEENVGLVTGDLVIRRDAPCKVMTTEILRNMLLCEDNIDNLMAVIVDEIHFLDDPSRGTTWEEMLIYLPHHVQIVGLSATLQNLNEFANWLSHVRKSPVPIVEERQRAVPLSYHIACKQTNLVDVERAKELLKNNRKRKPKKDHFAKRGKDRKRAQNHHATTHIDLFKMMRHKHWPYLYFTFSRAKTENLAFALKSWLHKSLLTEDEQSRLNVVVDDFKQQPGGAEALQPSVEEVLKHGVAFHHAGVHVLIKNLIESLYEQRLIKVLYCTGTFALGINMPAKSAVFDSLERYDGSGMIPLPTREFMQMAGRAGRRGLDQTGMVVIRMNDDEYMDFYPQIKGYLSAKYEPVDSRFSLSFNSVVNLLQRNPPERIRDLVEMSFLSWRRQNQAQREREEAEQLELQLQELVQHHSPHRTQRRTQNEITKRVDRANQMENQTWQEFQARVDFLKNYGYIGEDGSFFAGARVLTNFQIQEIFVTELFLLGLFENLTDGELFGLFCGLVVELPRNVYVFRKPNKRVKEILRDVRMVFISDIVRDSARITQQQLVWEPLMLPLGEAWVEGKSLTEIQRMFSSPTDISGTLIGAFRRAKDLLSQLRNVWEGVPEEYEHYSTLMKAVSRDEVEVVA